MTNIILSGCLGRMGRAVCAAAAERGDRIVAGIDPLGGSADYPVYTSPEEIPADCNADVIIDFSHHSALPALLEFARARNLPIVVATTGHTPEETAAMEAAARRIPVFFSRNMSLGINLLTELCRRAAATLGTAFDVEIIERHHNLKKDAPSGTALMLADSVNEAFDHAKRYVGGREGIVGAREKSEIGIHAVRGGTIVGEHEVMFAGEDEIITITHSARSKRVFAVGAIRAAKFLPQKEAGMYEMKDLLAVENA